MSRTMTMTQEDIDQLQRDADQQHQALSVEQAARAGHQRLAVQQLVHQTATVSAQIQNDQRRRRNGNGSRAAAGAQQDAQMSHIENNQQQDPSQQLHARVPSPALSEGEIPPEQAAQLQDVVQINEAASQARADGASGSRTVRQAREHRMTVKLISEPICID